MAHTRRGRDYDCACFVSEREAGSQMFVHFARRQEWLDAQETGEYAPPDLEENKFIGCATPKQAPSVANEQFSGQDDLVLLWIAPNKVKAGVIYERIGGAEVGELYPHLYGPLNVDAAVKVDELEPWEPGQFVLPKEPS